MNDFATIDDVKVLWRELTDDESAKVTELIPIVCNYLRYEAEKVGKNLDEMIANNPALSDIAKSVTVSVVKRYINDNSQDAVSMSQMSRAAGGYSISGTFLVAGGGLFIKRNELASLGLRRQRIGQLDYDFSN